MRRARYPGLLAAAVGAALASGVFQTSRGDASSATAAQRQPTDSIGVRNAHGLVFDAARGEVVAFGGADAATVRHDTWTWDARGRRWSFLTTEGPGPRTFPAMAFDAARGETVLFGGNRVLFGTEPRADTYLDDTWVFRGGGWTSRAVPGPPPRSEAAIAYDPRRRRIVLFGGTAQTASGRVRFGDTWEWDGSQLELKATTGPPARNGASLVYDAARGTLVLVGGPPASVSPAAWEWSGEQWTEIAEQPPPARFNAATIYHGGLKALLRFGGWTGKTRTGDTWIRTIDGWREVAGGGPAPRNHAGLAYDPTRRRAVQFGGHDGTQVFGDTWEFDGRAWRRAADAPPQTRVDNGH